MSNKRKFKDRVNIEREVLHLINASRMCSFELAGLSVPALSRWSEAALNQHPNSGVVNIATKLILEICERLRLNSDKSRDVFESDELVSRGTVEICICQLKEILLLPRL